MSIFNYHDQTWAMNWVTENNCCSCNMLCCVFCCRQFCILCILYILVRIGSPSRYQEVGEAGGTQVDIQSEEKASSDCTTIYKVVRKLPDHVTISGTWYGPWQYFTYFWNEFLKKIAATTVWCVTYFVIIDFAYFAYCAHFTYFVWFEGYITFIWDKPVMKRPIRSGGYEW